MKAHSKTTSGEVSHDPKKNDYFASDCSDGSVSLNSSTASFDCDLGECVIPLKTGGGGDEAEPERPPRVVRRNSLQDNIRSLAEQLAEDGEQQLPLSPAPKKKNLSRVFSPYNSPGALSSMRSSSVRSLSGRHHLSPGPLGGSLHGKSRRCNSPGPLGGSLHGRPRPRSPPPPGGLHGRPRSPPPGPLAAGGSQHGDPRTRSRSPAFTRPRRGSLTGGMRPRSKSPGPLSESTQGRGSLVGAPRARSKSPGALIGHRASLRLQRRQSKKNVTLGLASILRKGKFTQTAETEKPLPPIPTTSPCDSPSGHSGRSSLLSVSRRSFSLPRVKQVRFWFHDEASIADTYATEESMQFGDLGWNDSGEGFDDDPESEYGQRSMKGELPFIEVMDFDGIRYGEYAMNDNDDGDYLINKFNASTIQEEMGASDGFASFSSLLSEDELGSIRESKETSPKSHMQSFQSIPDLDDDDSSNHESSLGDSALYSKEQDSSPKKRLARQATPPAPFAGESSFTSFLSEESNQNESPSTRETPRIGNFKSLSTSSSTCRTDPSLDLSSWKKSESTSANAPQGKYVSVTSETSSESPTGVAEFMPEREDAELDSDENTNEGLKRSNLVSKLVPSVG